jgi:PAS domain S-box-containing protein
MKLATNILPYRIVNINEINQLKKTVERLDAQIKSARAFIKDIESGNLSSDVDNTLALGEDEHVLGASLLSMRDQMKKIADDEKQRNWATEGLAKFVDILRSNNDNLKDLGQVIISNIVKYTNSNQGSIFILNDEDPADIHLQMIACYAYNRKKHLDVKIGLGDGLVGQCVLEKASIYMTNLPEGYLKITSGLGEALPKNLLIVPLIINEKVYGVMEMASFNVFEKHHRDFLEKLAESIASTVSNVRVNEQTKKLLYETQAQAEQVRSQEEEMRQNMEELSATQEEMQRVLREVEGKEAYQNQLLNVSADSISTIDKNFNLVSWNKAFAKTLEQAGLQLRKGMNTLDWYPGDERKKQSDLYNRAFNGESFDFTASSEQNGGTYYHLSTYAPLRKESGEVYEVACFRKDISQMMNAQKNAEKLRQDAQNQTEELKAQEEELRQNMEELSATQDEMQRIIREVEGKEAYLNQLLNVSTDSIFSIDKEYKLVSWNKAFAVTLEKFGMKLEKGMNTVDWYPEAERKKQIEIYNRALSGESFELTASSNQNGSAYHHLSIYAPLKNEQGEVYEAAVFSKDITGMSNAQKHAEKLARDAQAKESYLSALINASKDSIFTLDKDFALISFNSAFSEGIRQMGIPLDKGFKMLDLFPDEKQKAEQCAHYTRAFKGESFEVTSKFDFDGKVSYYNSVFSPLKNANEEIDAIVVFGKDMTDLIVSKTTAESLAQEAKEKTEEMKAQEEELRQNMEELSASQDEMHRIMKELELKGEYTTDLLNASEDMIFTINKDFRLESWNETFEHSTAKYGRKIEKGFNTLEWYPVDTQRQEQIAIYKRVFAGESFETSFSTGINNQTYYFKSCYKPLKNNMGQVYEVATFTRDITSSMKDSVQKIESNTKILQGEKMIMDLIRSSKYNIYTIDRNFKLLYFNDTFEKTMAHAGITIEIGMDMLAILPEKKERLDVQKQLKRAFNGETFEQVQEFNANNATAYMWQHYKPIKNIDGEVIAAGVHTEDITEFMTLKKTNTLLLKKIGNNN